MFSVGVLYAAHSFLCLFDFVVDDASFRSEDEETVKWKDANAWKKGASFFMAGAGLYSHCIALHRGLGPPSS